MFYNEFLLFSELPCIVNFLVVSKVRCDNDLIDMRWTFITSCKKIAVYVVIDVETSIRTTHCFHSFTFPTFEDEHVFFGWGGGGGGGRGGGRERHQLWLFREDEEVTNTTCSCRSGKEIYFVKKHENFSFPFRCAPQRVMFV